MEKPVVMDSSLEAEEAPAAEMWKPVPNALTSSWLRNGSEL